MKETIEPFGIASVRYVYLTFYEKWLVFWRLLKTEKLQSGYTIEEILEDGF